MCTSKHQYMFSIHRDVVVGNSGYKEKGARERGNGGVYGCAQSCLYVQTYVNNIGLVSSR